MTDPIVARKGPYTVDVEKGVEYAWCRCGRSRTEPWCDGSHKGTGIRPLVFKAERTETLALCGCKHTRDEPLCDGTHEDL